MTLLTCYQKLIKSMLPQSKKKDIENVIESVIKDPTPNNDYWWEEDF